MDITSLLYTFVGILGISWYIQFYWKRRKLYEFASKLTGPKGWPVVALYNYSFHVYDKNSYISRVWLGPILVVAISKPEYIEKVLSSPNALSKIYLYKYSRTAAGNGIFTTSGPIWKRHRKVIMPTFNQKILDSFIPIFQKHANVMSQQIEKKYKDKEFDFFDAICKCTLDSFCETAMGVEINSQITNAEFSNWIGKLMDFMYIRMYFAPYQCDLIYRRSQMYKEEKELAEKYHSFTKNIIKEKQTNRNVSNEKKIFLDHLMDQDAFSDEELRDEVNTFILAGTDTSSGTVGFIFLMLAMHKDVQEKVYQEVKDFAHFDITPHDISNMHYTERVIKETLRLFPVGPMIVRKIDSDIVLSDDLILPEGACALVSIAVTHRSPLYWDNPLKFDPDRFLPEKISKQHPYAFIPFSAGARNCVGLKYAMMSMTVFVATILQKYEISTSYKSVEEIKLKIELTLKPLDGYKLSVKLRENV